jgi:hypothetical protein
MGYLTVSQSYDPNDMDENNQSLTPKQSSSNFKKQNCYYSDVVGEYIKDAVTGAKYPWRVGSLDEQRFFRVTYTIGYVDPSRKGVYNSMGRSSKKAFYENPDAYLKHVKYSVELDQETINAWYNKQEELYPGRYIKVN